MHITLPMQPLQEELRIEGLYSLFYANRSGDSHFDGESHDFWELVYVDKGSALITAGKREYILRANEIAFHMPEEHHAVNPLNGQDLSCVIASFCCHSHAMRAFEHTFLTLTAKERQHLFEALALGEQVFTCDRRQKNWFVKQDTPLPFGIEQQIKNHLELMLIRLIQRQGSAADITARAESYRQMMRSTDLETDVKAYLREHLARRVSLSEVSRHVGVSVSVLKKHFALTGGVINLQIDMKIAEAKRLLRLNEMNVSQIAEALGYESSAYFARQFRAKTHMTPSEYKNKGYT